LLKVYIFMKTVFILFLFMLTMSRSSFAQSYQMGLNYNPHKFYLTNDADKLAGSGYSEILPNLLSGNSFGVFFNKALNHQSALQLDLNFLHQKQYYLFTSLESNKSDIYTSFSSINIILSHNLYLWNCDESDDNVFFSYGVSVMNILNYTDYYNVETDTKTNGVTQKEVTTTIIEKDSYISTTLVSQNDTTISLTGDAKKGIPRYNNFNVGATFGLHFLHYFTDNMAFTVGATGTYYFMDPENKSSTLWNQNSKYKYGNIPTLDKRGVTKMYTYGVSLSLIYSFGRY
jgi:hypothetical protein